MVPDVSVSAALGLNADLGLPTYDARVIERTVEPRDGRGTGGSGPIGLVIGLAVAGSLILLPAVIVPLFYLFANVYALIVGSDFSSETMNVAVFLTGLVMAVTVPLLLLSGAVALIGRSLSPKNRDA
jgi:hypothetical protein